MNPFVLDKTRMKLKEIMLLDYKSIFTVSEFLEIHKFLRKYYFNLSFSTYCPWLGNQLQPSFHFNQNFPIKQQLFQIYDVLEFIKNSKFEGESCRVLRYLSSSRSCLLFVGSTGYSYLVNLYCLSNDNKGNYSLRNEDKSNIILQGELEEVLQLCYRDFPLI